jgi:hypothetical protein
VISDLVLFWPVISASATFEAVRLCINFQLSAVKDFGTSDAYADNRRPFDRAAGVLSTASPEMRRLTMDGRDMRFMKH